MNGFLVRGYTLIEVVIVLIITGILVMTVNPFFKINLKSYLAVRSGKEMLQASRIGLNRMANEMRRMQQFDLWYISSDEIQFVTRNPDGSAPGGTTKYDYNSSKGWLEREDIRLVEGVSAFNITGYKRDNVTTTTDETQVWKIQISITVGMDPNKCIFRENIFPKGLRQATDYVFN
jgi:prepilin-type N-terminal cleavage/methylation domain-containing protein